MNGATYAALVGLAVLDSANLSAIVGTIYLLVSPRSSTSRVLMFVAALYIVYVVFGVALMAGLTGIAPQIQGSTAYAVEGIVGAVMLVYGVFAPVRRAEPERLPRSFSHTAIFALGVTAAMIEAITALPYIGAIAILTREGIGLPAAVPVILVYNVIFVSPCLLLLIVYRLLGARFQDRLQRFADRQREKNNGSEDRAAPGRAGRVPTAARQPAVLRVLRPGRHPGRHQGPDLRLITPTDPDARRKVAP